MIRIAQIAPLFESVPPRLYGGTERVVSYLTDELVNQGHDVTLFASGDSVTKATLISIQQQALRLSDYTDPMAYQILQMQEVIERASEFDLLHFHTDYLHFPLSRLTNNISLTTLHGRLNIPELIPLYQKFSEMPVVSISDSQRLPLPGANWAGTVYHGLPLDLYKKGEGKGNYVAFVGRISIEKRVDFAIEIARRAGINIKIAAKIDKADEMYYEKNIRHLFELPHVEYIGEIGEDQKGDFLGNAKAMLFPIDWPEPFGMVLIEAMACGTPTIAYNRGSVPEIIEHGKTGVIVENIEQAVEALNNIDRIDRNVCRTGFENRFSATIMAKNYAQLYERLLAKKHSFV